jgi:hypothetical protein
MRHDRYDNINDVGTGTCIWMKGQGNNGGGGGAVPWQLGNAKFQVRWCVCVVVCVARARVKLKKKTKEEGRKEAEK